MIYSFDLQLEKFGVDLDNLKQPATSRIFRAWVEDWEEEIMKTNDCVAEAKLLEKYKNLVFHDPDENCMFTVAASNLEYRRGREGGWFLVCEPNEDDKEPEPFDITLANKLIAATLQGPGVKVVHPEETLQVEEGAV